MPESVKTAITKTKRGIWKYFGAMMTEKKDGVQAMSYTRTLGLILFIACLFMWFGVGGHGETGADVPESMLHTLWVLLGIKGLKDVGVAVSGKDKEPAA